MARALDGLRVVLIHDWLTGMRGGEKVLESLCRLFPNAGIRTLVHKRGSTSELLESRALRPSFVSALPGANQLYRYYLPIFPLAVETIDLDEADVVISTSHCAAKAVVPTGRAVHICYCHSPMRYAWDQFDAYFGADRVGRLPSAVLRPTMAWLARWDRRTAGRVDRYVANSAFVAGRIGRYYNREASVVHPPVDTRFFTPDGSRPEPYFLVVSALVPYKRIDVAIRAAGRLGVPLKIVGTGPDRARLERGASSNVSFLGALSAEELRSAYRGATALVLPAEEDFGISVVEAMACGRPVIALAKGGATETVEPGRTGWLVDSLSEEAFADAMRDAQTSSWNPAAIAAHAAQFSTERFEAQFFDVVTKSMGAAAC
jgi:glycosyltransferase involved in cell wall biosynthesis